jgi:nucleoside-diphosphate-sugar epimerase
MRLFITGSESFVGRELLLQCAAAGIECTGVDAAPTSHPGFQQLDVRSPRIEESVPWEVDAVVHLAAMSRDADCVDHLYDTLDVNVMGTLNLMRAAKARRARQFIFASSEWVYDSCSAEVLKTENSVVDISQHTSEYALSKLIGEATLRQQYIRGFCDTTILRFGIIYGPRPSNWSAVEAIFDTVRRGEPVRVGSGDTARSFIHVTDIAHGIIKSVGMTGFNVVNLEGRRLIRLAEIAQTSALVLGVSAELIESGGPASIRAVSGDRALAMLDWTPTIDLEAGLRSLL